MRFGLVDAGEKKKKKAELILTNAYSRFQIHLACSRRLCVGNALGNID